MIKYKYIFNGNQLYKVVNRHKNLLEVISTQELLTKQLARFTYSSNQLESLGYVIVESRCVL